MSLWIWRAAVGWIHESLQLTRVGRETWTLFELDDNQTARGKVEEDWEQEQGPELEIRQKHYRRGELSLLNVSKHTAHGRDADCLHVQHVLLFTCCKTVKTSSLQNEVWHSTNNIFSTVGEIKSTFAKVRRIFNAIYLTYYGSKCSCYSEASVTSVAMEGRKS